MPFPGKMLVKPLDENSPIQNHIRFVGGKTPAKGQVIRMPKPQMRVGIEGKKELMPMIDTPVLIKEGDIIFYENEWIWEFEIESEIYHLISAYNIVAKIG